MTEGTLAQATGLFREHGVSPGLRTAFSAVWIHDLPGVTPPIVVMPDATIDIEWIGGKLRVAGPDAEPQVEMIQGGGTVVGLRFSPAAAARWLGVPAGELLGMRVSLDDLWGRRARDLERSIRLDAVGKPDIAALLRLVVSSRPAIDVDPAMRAAFELIDNSPPPDAPLVPWLTRALAMSERTLRRRFDETFGYGPRTLARILRYQRYLRLTRGGGSTAMLAAEAGYADQAHLVRESRRLTMHTPQSLLTLLGRT
ncbi:AraC family transcriptional regulator [Devosia nitrariae]|uniref:Transcriptional regulator n=1 Tax=Devosia nitrariae TaxID=2071872 RepID=A0ABQ5W284_9HYPH|nr:AraC family transcriptional regulator [Devosia nitrariae]GLQ54015.1 transcriptional regulator [Devosia nitrariae]